jgi:Leucine-rich repeat (LRR) protein
MQTNTLSTITMLQYSDLGWRNLSKFPKSVQSQESSVMLARNKLNTLEHEKLPGKTVELSLFANDLREMPTLSANSLKRLQLGYNKLKIFPSNIAGNYPSLTVLDLSGNKIESLPPNLRFLTSLRALYLADNRLTRIPADIGKLVNLTILVLRDNNIALLPKEIGKLTHLTDLHLQGNKLAILPKELGELQFDRVGTCMELDCNPLDKELALHWQDQFVSPRQLKLIQWIKSPEYANWLQDKTKQALATAKIYEAAMK